MGSEDDAKKPPEVELSTSKDDAPQGLITEDGQINWNCPCLGGMAVGPCGVEFREAFSCFHYSEDDPKGADCIEKLADMQDCMSKYPEIYGDKDKTEADLDKATTESASVPTNSSEEKKAEESSKSEATVVTTEETDKPTTVVPAVEDEPSLDKLALDDKPEKSSEENSEQVQTATSWNKLQQI